jgi:hypothetical protein
MERHLRQLARHAQRVREYLGQDSSDRRSTEAHTMAGLS